MRETTYKVHSPIVRVLDQREIVCPVWMVKASQQIRHILEAIADEFYVDPIDIMAGNFTEDVTEARQVAYWVLRQSTRMSSKQIAHKLNRRDHTSALTGIKAVELRRSENSDYRALTNAILARSMAGRPPVAVPTPSPFQLAHRKIA
jgi:hypothetical protein